MVYVADDAKIGYPAVRFAVPDMQYHAWLVGLRKSMESMLTGDSLTGGEAVACGYADPLVPRRGARGEHAGDGDAHRADPHRPRADQQAQRAPGDGDHGCPRRVKAGIPLTLASTRTETFRNFMAELAGGLSQAFKKRDAAYRDAPPPPS